MARRRFLAQLAGWPLAALFPAVAVAHSRAPRLKILLKSAWGSDDPTKAAFPFSHGHVLSEAGHEVRIFLLGEAVGLMRRSVAEAVTPVAWPRVSELLHRVSERKIPIYACGTCARARGITEADLATWGAAYGNPRIFVSLVEWADKVITE
jgi:predicted peroxiredoxin